MISERLRGWLDSSSPERHEAIEAEAREAVDVIDALVEAAERGKYYVDSVVRKDGGIEHCDVGYRVDSEAIDAALAMARRT